MQVPTRFSVASLAFSFVLACTLFVDFAASLPMQQLGMFNMIQFHHGNKAGLSAIDRARRATRVRHHRESPRGPRELPIAMAEKLALCKYNVTVDDDPLRIPRKIPIISCEKNDDCQCTKKGEGTYQCTQLYTNMTVEYLNKDGSKNGPGDITVKYGCVCASETGGKGQGGDAKR